MLRKTRHRGYRDKTILSSLGELELERLYTECSPCDLRVHPADATLGLESGYTVGARRLAVFAGTNWSFDKSAEHLKEFCGLELSDNTIRELCKRESPKMEHWQRNDVDSHKEFRAAEGETEFTCDGTCVNTTEG